MALSADLRLLLDKAIQAEWNARTAENARDSRLILHKNDVTDIINSVIDNNTDIQAQLVTDYTE